MKREIPPTAGLPLNGWDFIRQPGSRFAQQLAQQLDIPKPALTCSGTAALVIALRTLQQQRPGRNEIIVPAYTCPLVALAAHYCPPLKVIVCDLQADQIDLDENALRTLCTEKTLAVVVTHLAGRVADVAAAQQIANRVGAAVIEDAAQAMGAQHNGQPVGLHGDIGFYSLAIGKGLTSAEGGVLFSRDPALHRALHQRSAQDLPDSPLWELRRSAELLGYGLCYRPALLPWVYGQPLRRALAAGDLVRAVGDDFTADDIPLHSLGKYRQRVASAALKRLPAYLQQTREQALKRIEKIKTIQGLRILDDQPGQQGTWPFLTIIMPSTAARDRALQQLWPAGLGVTRLFIHTLPDYQAVAPYVETPLPIPNARDFAARMLTVSNSHWLTEDEFAHILRTLLTA